MSQDTQSIRTAPDRAMQAAMAKDREGWLGTFAEDALLRDPVGGSVLDPNGTGLRGRKEMSVFWDAVVRPAQSVRFDIHQDYPSGSSVARVATVHIAYAAGDPITYDGVFVYEMNDDGLIASMSGYFTPPTG